LNCIFIVFSSELRNIQIFRKSEQRVWKILVFYCWCQNKRNISYKLLGNKTTEMTSITIEKNHIVTLNTVVLDSLIHPSIQQQDCND